MTEDPSPHHGSTPLEQEAWFQNLRIGVRNLVATQSDRSVRHHLLAAIDESVRRLQAGEAGDAARARIGPVDLAELVQPPQEPSK